MQKDENVTRKGDYEYIGWLRVGRCPNCSARIGDMPGSRNAHCKTCGFKDPCCGD